MKDCLGRVDCAMARRHIGMLSRRLQRMKSPAIFLRETKRKDNEDGEVKQIIVKAYHGDEGRKTQSHNL